MSLDPLVLALTAHAHSFFVLSPQDARRLAVRAVELAPPDADEADVVDLMNLLWRANRDARRIEESDRHVPICLIVEDPLPDEFVLEVEEARSSRYAEHFRRQPRGQEEYEGFPAPWRVAELNALRERQAAEHLASRHDHHTHHADPLPESPEERQRRVERDLRSAYGDE